MEMLVSLTVLSLTLGALATMMIETSRVNRNQQSEAQVQADARSCLLLVVQRLRSAGWDPTGLGFDAVTVDPDLTDDISWIEFRADVNGDGDLDDDYEQVVVRHMGRQVEWRIHPDQTFVVVADDITNDADGDGKPEPMFEVWGDPPTSVEVTITAESTNVNTTTGEPIRFTVDSEIQLRSRLLPLR
jgi:hypothetical protein